jgi:hypothetical protein
MLPANAKSEKALLCVLVLDISATIRRNVLRRVRAASGNQAPWVVCQPVCTDTRLPENTPPRLLNRTICQTVCERPNRAAARDIPARVTTSTGFRP